MKVPKFIAQNAFNVVGLPTTTPINEAKRRSSHLISLSKIDETEAFESDLGEVQTLRKEAALRKAIEKLTSVKDRLGEAFFWYEMDTANDESLFKRVSSGNYEEAAEGWATAFEKSKNWITKKNLALTLCLLSFQRRSESDFANCISTWRDIWKSDEFWDFYSNYYSTHDDLGTSKDLFIEFRYGLGEHLSRFTVEAYHQIGSAGVVGIFYSRFDIVGREIEDNIITPISKKMLGSLDTLYGLASAETYKLSRTEFSQSIKDIEDCLASLKDLGVDSYSPVQVLKEKAAEKLRSISIALHNNQDDIQVSKQLLDLSISLNESHSFQAQAKKDKVQLRKNEVFVEELLPKLVAVKNEAPEKRYQVLLEVQETLPKDVELTEELIDIRRGFVCEYAVDLFVKGKELLLERKDEMGAVVLFSRAHDLLVKHLSEFALNKDKVLKMAADLSNECLAVKDPDYLTQIDTRLNQVHELGNKIDVDDSSKTALVLMLQSVLCRDIAPYRRRVRFGNYLTSIGNFTFWIYGIGVAFRILGFLYYNEKYLTSIKNFTFWILGIGIVFWILGFLYKRKVF